MTRGHLGWSGILAGLLWCGWAVSAVAETERADLGSMDGWAVVDSNGQVPDGAVLRVDPEGLTYLYRRGLLSPLVHHTTLAQLRELRLTLSSEEDATFVIAVQDVDGAKFVYRFGLHESQPRTIRVRPGDFQLGSDSPIRKLHLDPSRLGTGYTLFDLGGATGAHADSTNVVYIRAVEIDRDSPRIERGDLIVDRAITIADSVERDGDIYVVKGGSLWVTAPHFVLRGQLSIEDGTAEFEGGVIEIPQRYPREQRIVVGTGARLRIRRAVVKSDHLPFTLRLLDQARYEVEETEFEGGVSCQVRDSTRVWLLRAVTPGEFIVAPGGELSVQNSTGVSVWLTLGSAAKGRLALPAGERIATWQSGQGLNVHIQNSSDITWGLLSLAGSDCVIEDSNLSVVGWLVSEGLVRFRDIPNGGGHALTIHTPDRSLGFLRTTVREWHFYADGSARVGVERCVYGDAETFGSGHMEVADSTSAPGGSTVASHGESRLRLLKCSFTGSIAAREHSSLLLDRCRITGPLFADDQATVRLTGSTMTGPIHQEAGATVVHDEATPEAEP